MDGLEGYAFSGEGTIGVVLDTTITDILREEGFVREIISKIQNLRKEKGFEVSDKINIYVKDSFNLINIIDKYKEIIQRETLTLNIYFNEDKLGLNYVDLNINKGSFSFRCFKGVKFLERIKLPSVAIVLWLFQLRMLRKKQEYPLQLFQEF